MPSVTTTTTVLLNGLHDPANAEAWATFDARYRPVVVGFARRLGLGDADAADVAQETMARFVQQYREGRYDRDRGRLRTWLIAVARSRIADVWRSANRRAAGPIEHADVLDDEARLTLVWEEERRRRMLDEAMARLRTTTKTEPKTIEAFQRLVLGESDAATVAAQLDMSTEDVYRAKNRIAERLRGIIDEMERAWEDKP